MGDMTDTANYASALVKADRAGNRLDAILGEHVDKIRKLVDAHGGGFVVCDVRDLRNILGRARTGKDIAQDIAKAVKEAGFHHLPLEIPRNQDAKVLVYSEAVVPVVFLVAAIAGGTVEADSMNGALTMLGLLLDSSQGTKN